MRDIQLELIAELLKNSRRSDRELARALKTSQPTVTRNRIKLEKEGYLREYTVIPDFRKLGFELASFILVRLKKELSTEEIEKARQISKKDMAEKAPDEMVLFSRGMGGGYTGVLVSLHKSYSDYARFVQRLEDYPFVDTSATVSFLIDLNDTVQYRYLTFSTLAKYLRTLRS